MTPSKNILALEYNAIEAKVFMQYFDHHKDFNYFGNYHIDSTLQDLNSSCDVILININTNNYRNCVSFLRNYPRTIASRIFLTSNVYFDNLTQLVHNYNVQIILKPIRKDCLFHLISQPVLSFHRISQYNDETINNEYISFIQSFLKCNEDNFPIWTKKAFLLLTEKHTENEKLLQEKIQVFASLFIYFITQNLETEKIVQLTHYYNDLLYYFKVLSQPKYLLQKMAVFFKNCYSVIHPDCVSIDQKRISELKLRIQQYIDDEQDFSLDTIAQEMHISVSHLSKIFKKNENMTYRAYIHSLRLSKACYLLSSTNQTIEEIAVRCGYQEISSFSRAFKEAFNLSPYSYRKKHREITL